MCLSGFGIVFRWRPREASGFFDMAQFGTVELYWRIRRCCVDRVDYDI